MSTLTDQEKVRLACDVLLREIHTADVILETHAGIMTALNTALLYVAFGLKPGLGMDALSVLGLVFGGEMFLHTYRLGHIASSARGRLETILDNLGIDAKRLPTKILGVPVPKGSKLLLGLSAIFMAIWAGLIIAVHFYGYSPAITH